MAIWCPGRSGADSHVLVARRRLLCQATDCLLKLVHTASNMSGPWGCHIGTCIMVPGEEVCLAGLSTGSSTRAVSHEEN